MPPTGSDGAHRPSGVASAPAPKSLDPAHRPGVDRHNAPRMTLVELAPGVSLDEIRAKTEAAFEAGSGIN